MNSHDLLKFFNIELNARIPMPIEVEGFKREALAQWFGEWDFKEGAEIGTYAGEYAYTLCVNNPGLKLHCIDPWKIYPGYVDFERQETLDKAYATAKMHLAQFGCNLIRATSIEASKQFKDGSLDFIYIDGNHELNYVIEDLYTWIPKVRKGGIISGHDYIKRNRHPQLQVVEAVHAYTGARRIWPWFVLGQKIRHKGGVGDYPRSWLWVNDV